jgi:hypothetical protein
MDADHSGPDCYWFHPTPGKLLIVLLVVEGILMLSEPLFQMGWAVLTAVAAVGAFLILMLIWFVFALLFRRQFQFSLRTLLTVAVAIPSSWLAMELKWAKERRESVEAWSKLGGVISYDYDSAGISTEGGATSTCLSWLRKAFGDELFVSAVSAYIRDMKVNNADLRYLKEFSELNNIQMEKIQITDNGLEQFEGMRQLRWLTLTEVSITDAGLEHLKELKELRCLFLFQTKVTDAGVAKLQKALPKCQIEH